MARNEVKSLLRKAKRMYVKTHLDLDLSSKAHWTGINKLITLGVNKSQIESKQIESESFTDHLEIASKFNTHFTGVAGEITRGLNPPFCLIEFMRGRLSSPDFSLQLSDTDPEEVQKTIKALKNTAPGIDKVSTTIIIASCDYISSPLKKSPLEKIF